MVEKNNFSFKEISAPIWKENFEQSAHISVFGEEFDPLRTRMDYAILTVNEKDEMIIYMTVQEMDKYTAFLEYGGSFPDKRGSMEVFPAFSESVDYLLKKYNRVNFYTENKNFPMLKLGMKKGFKIVGLCISNNKILLEHTLERGE